MSASAAAAATAAATAATGTDAASPAAAAPAAVGKPTTGRSLFYLHPHFVWLPCEVLAWDADQHRFLVSFFSEAEMRASKDMQPALEELVQVRSFVYFFGLFFRLFLRNDRMEFEYFCVWNFSVANVGAFCFLSRTVNTFFEY